jgi:hypothetical protein
MTRFPRLLPLVTLLLVGLTALAGSPPKPNFTGKWVLNVAKSDFGPLPGPKSRTDEIAQKDTHLTVTRHQVAPNDQTSTVKVECVIGGGDCTTTYQQGQLKAKASWDGQALVVDSVLSSGGVDAQVRDLYTLSADGKVLTIRRHIATGDGEGDQAFVLDKQ